MQGLLDYSSSDDEDAVIEPAKERAGGGRADLPTMTGVEFSVPEKPPVPPGASAESHAVGQDAPFVDYLSELPQVRSDGVSAETLARLGQYLEAQRQYNFDLTDSIQRKKDFGNPHILTKVVDFFHIDELGSNYPKELFDPSAIKRKNEVVDPSPAPPLGPVATLASAPVPRNSLQFVPASMPEDGAGAASKPEKKRKSRWDG